MSKRKSNDSQLQSKIKYFFFWNNIGMLPYNCFYIFTWFFIIINDEKNFA